MPNIVLTGILVLSLFSSAQAFPSEELKQLWDIPTSEVKAETVKTFTKGKVKVEEVYFYSRPFNRKPVKIFAYFAYPTVRSGKLPAILLSHGGGGSASLPRSVEWAKRGYAVLAIDLPGKGENRRRSRSTGPDMIVANLLRTQPDPSASYLIQMVAAARNGITYLSQRKEVDPNRIGMIGLSWGGVLTLLTNGQDKRLKAAVNIFGAGYIPEGCTWEDWFKKMPANDKETWNKYLDPKNFLATQHAPILFITGTNDHCYYLPTFQKSYLAIKAPKKYFLIPNLKHRFLSSSSVPALAWFDQKLKYGGTFPSLTELPTYFPTQEGTKVIVPIKITAQGKTRSVTLFYNKGGPQQWTTGEWKKLTPYSSGETHYFSLPTKLISPEVLFFISARDQHNGAVSTLVKSIFKVKLEDGSITYGLSSPITKIYRHDPPFKLLNSQAAEDPRFYYSKPEKAYRLWHKPD